MQLLDALLSRRRLVIATTLLLAMAGYGAWLTMPREEDPQFPRRDALIVTVFPGADALAVERLVVEPLEEGLAEVQEVRMVDSTARAGVAIQHVELHETVYDTASAWDEVEDAIAEARKDFPAGVLPPDLDDDLVSQEAMVYAITGSADPLVLVAAAEQLERELLTVDAVKEVSLVADPGEQIFIEYDDATARRLGLDPTTLGLQLSQRSLIVPGGLIHLGDRTASLRPQTEFRSLEEIRQTPVLLPSGSSIPLGELARVRRGPAEPPTAFMRWNGEPAVGVAITPQDGLDRVKLGERVRAKVAEVTPTLAPLEVEEMIFQPDQVQERLTELTNSLQLGILIVAGVLFLVMGPRLGVVVAVVVPLVAFGSIALFALGGGILHQISIASLVIALGMLVDNAIVVVENIQYRLDQGKPMHVAAVDSVKELAMPLGTATGTTLAAFVPMLVSKGNTADFTRSIPIMIMLSLTVSYLFAVLVTPVLSELVLKRSKKEAGDSRTRRLGTWISGVAIRRPLLVMIGAVALLGATVFASRWVEVKFFPSSDRKTVIVELEMPEGTHIEATDAVASRVERALLGHQHVDTVATYVGRNGPKFYYNLLSQPSSPHRSMLIADVDRLDALEEVIAFTRDFVHREAPEVSVVARRLEQGPPVEAPLELKVLGHDLEDMEVVADAVLAEIRSLEGTEDVRHDLGQGVPTVRFEIDDAAAGRHGLSRADVARALAGRTLGMEIGQYRIGDDPVPILVRSSEGEELPVTELATIDLPTPSGRSVPLAQLATLEVEWLPAAIQHEDRSRLVKVQSQLAEGRTAHAVYQELLPRLEAMEIPAGVEVKVGGELEESGRANSAILRQMPVGIMLLLFFLLLEFNSFRRVGIILMTVPLAAVGVVPGLILSQNPFGFMSMLGVISLVGIVVNNAIVLLDVIETRRSAGASIDLALREAVERRTRPILLTMATTVAGLSPLAFSGAALWPPLAWAMISGLIASTVLTLLVVPALYKLLLGRELHRQLPSLVDGEGRIDPVSDIPAGEPVSDRAPSNESAADGSAADDPAGDDPAGDQTGTGDSEDESTSSTAAAAEILTEGASAPAAARILPWGVILTVVALGLAVLPGSAQASGSAASDAGERLAASRSSETAPSLSVSGNAATDPAPVPDLANLSPELAEILELAKSMQSADRLLETEGPEPVSLAEAMARAENRPQALAADARTASAEGLALAERRAAILPVVGVGGDVTLRDRDFEFDTPLGSFTLGERTSTSLALGITQPIYDPARLRYRAPAARETAIARRHQAARLRQEARAEAASAWLAVLAIDANLRSTEAFVESLEARSREMEARVGAGRVLEADLLEIRLELESAVLDRDRGLAQRGVAVRDLARAMGSDGGAEPEWDGVFDRRNAVGEPEFPDLEAALMAALVGRPDLNALQARLRSLDLEARAIRAERLPKVEAQLSVSASDGDPFNPEELVQGVVSVSWNPFAAGTRAPRVAAAEAEKEAVRAEVTEIVRAVALQMQAALAELSTAREAVTVRERGVELAEETSRVERERHAAGRSTTNDLLDAEATLRLQRTARDLARLEVMRAWIAYDLAVGG